MIALALGFGLAQSFAHGKGYLNLDCVMKTLLLPNRFA
jgi:hypothetical protein